MKQHFNRHNSEVDYRTPRQLFENLQDRYGVFDINVAASQENHLCELWYSEGARNALFEESPWTGNVRCNPPYDDVGPWVAKAIESINTGEASQVVMLLPARTCTRWFRMAWENCYAVEFIHGRLNFTGPNSLDEGKAPAPFPSVLMVFNHWMSADCANTPRVRMITRRGIPMTGKQSTLMEWG